MSFHEMVRLAAETEQSRATRGKVVTTVCADLGPAVSETLLFLF